MNKLKLDDYFIEIMSEPVEILSKNLQEIYAIILIVTDCTKFSSNIYAAKRINETLVRYVRKGGKLIGAHDVIYRRTKNELLQNMFGCKIVNFEQTETVHYHKTEECLEEDRFSNLPEDFVLHDAEICWEKLQKMLMCILKQSRGSHLYFQRIRKWSVYLLNSGDFKEKTAAVYFDNESEAPEEFHPGISKSGYSRGYGIELDVRS